MIYYSVLLDDKFYVKSKYQQHPDFFVYLSFFKDVPGLVLPPVFLFGLPCTFDLISFDKVVKAFSTFTASLADVSKNLIPNESAKVLPSSAFTDRLA